MTQSPDCSLQEHLRSGIDVLLRSSGWISVFAWTWYTMWCAQATPEFGVSSNNKCECRVSGICIALHAALNTLEENLALWIDAKTFTSQKLLQLPWPRCVGLTPDDGCRKLAIKHVEDNANSSWAAAEPADTGCMSDMCRCEPKPWSVLPFTHY